ncbi:hypothetical protein ABMA27_002310 [Loxostege sticticalis]|uniref:tRNA/rRNA methyltransferase SpoU type domain-containing protein n=1 Tax=Loxostege sticticalis TaxID=481309 RepID=A0ABR3HXC6_LOXSC
MNSQEDVLSFMDLLDLDESLIDMRLKSIMNKDTYSKKHLINAIQLLRYKHLVNAQDETDCDNEEACNFAAKLIKQVSEENIENVCQIVAITLTLDTETIINKSEHLLQQILSELDVPNEVKDSESPEPNYSLLNLKIADSILEAVIKKGGKLTLPFLDLPVSKILLSADEQLKIHFLTSSVPKLFQGIEDYNILDKIWDFIKQFEDNNREVTLKVLSSLSEFYLPVADSKGKVLFETEIVNHYEFWHNILYGLSSTDPSLRKTSIYLAKRALDCIMAMDKDISVKTENHTIFVWNHSKRMTAKIIWDNFFILMDSLEEKQSNIVLPSLQLFGSLKSLGHWLNCAFNIGLKHDNTQVRLKCIQHRLETKISSQSEAIVLLEALNDINIYDNYIECGELKKKVSAFMNDKKVFVNILTSIPMIKWSPVPLYHISSLISEITFKDFISEINGMDITELLIEILKVPCNNIAVRKAVLVNISHFVGNCCDGLHWKDYVNIYCVVQSELKESELDSPLNSMIAKIAIKDEEKTDFFQLIEYFHIDFCLLYLRHHPEDMAFFINVLLNKIKKAHDVVTRQYSDKSECLKDVIYLTQLYKKSGTSIENINIIVEKEYKTILHYLLCLLSNDTKLSIDEMSILSNGFISMSNSINNLGAKEILLQLYKASVSFIKARNTVLESKLLGMFLVNALSSNPILIANYKHEMIGIKDIITLTSSFENTSSVGRLRNVFYEKSCEILDYLLNDKDVALDRHAKDIAEYIENVIECGGYGCLRWCLKIMNTILPCLLQDENNKFDVAHFISRMWKEIEELKSNNQYNPCIEQFVHLITQDVLLKKSMYNNVIIAYCNKIIEHSALKTAPLFYLIKKLNRIEFTADYGQMIYVLCEVLLYSPVPRKDQRILENLVVDILQQPKFGFKEENTDIHFNYQIQYLSILAISKINDKDILANIGTFIRNRVDEEFRNKQRYHGHSQAHRLLLTALQHLLLISVLIGSGAEKNVDWCVELLGKLPHQPSVRICLEWFIALHLCMKKPTLNEEIIECLKNTPLTSQFMILYWTVKHKILSKQCSHEEYDFVMDFLLSHTMGQMFNIRLHAQYLAVKLHSIYKTDSSKYSYTIKVIERTFIESEKDKNFMKLQQDYFVNNFDIVNDFTPSFIYYFLPRYCEINNNEIVDLTYVKNVIKSINENISNCDFFRKYRTKSDEEVFGLDIAKNVMNKVVDDVEATGTIQKKYIPWKNMSDVNVYESGKKKETASELIVVASLIDKLPNLGGMARTGEVFGVREYVVPSLRHLQDKQFQGLSVSAERWIDVDEVRPGAPLKEYLTRKRAEGYSVVAAEQTSTSSKLQAFKFPKKTLLLLGHEKEGIPCDLLPMMDHCVEIPQQGFVRSLNVHVTAAIFIWEYTRQNIL